MKPRVLASLASSSGSLWRKLSQFKAADAGVAAVEFAAILPLMVLMYLGTVELVEGVSTDRKVTLLSRTLADLTTQASSSFDMTAMNNIFDASTSVLAPFPITGLQMVVTDIAVDNAGKATVSWSCTRGGTKDPTGSVVTLPAGLNSPNSTLVMSKVQLPYTPMFHFVVKADITLHETVYMKPRSSTIPNPGC